MNETQGWWRGGQEPPLTETEYGFHNLNLEKSILEGKVIASESSYCFPSDSKMKGFD